MYVDGEGADAAAWAYCTVHGLPRRGLLVAGAFAVRLRHDPVTFWPSACSLAVACLLRAGRSSAVRTDQGHTTIVNPLSLDSAEPGWSMSGYLEPLSRSYMGA